MDLSAITAAQTDLVAAAAALLALGIAVWGSMKVARMFGIRARDKWHEDNDPGWGPN